MTEITEVLTSINKSKLSIEDVNKEVNNSLGVILKNMTDLVEPIEEIIKSEKKQNEEITNYNSSNMALSSEISSLKNEKSSKESLLMNSQTNFSEITDKRTKLEGQIRETTTDLQNTKNKLASAKEELEKLNIEHNKLVAEIEETIKSTEIQIMELNKASNQKRDNLRKVKGERMALEYLIKRGYIEFNEIKIINSLEGRKTTDLSTISKVTGLSENLIEKTLTGLMQRNLLAYDSSTGAITVTGNLRL